MEIVVVGSLNMDTVAMVERLPQAGETVMAHGHFTNPGGKGANQAVAAARLGRSVALLGCVGGDASGDALLTALEADGVETTAVRRVTDPSGMAVITVGPDGDNTIVVSPGANSAVTPAIIEESAELLTAAEAILVQLEIPLDAVATTLATAPGLKVLNPAPAQPLDPALVALADVVVPNETELALLTGEDPASDPRYVAMAAASLGERVVVTLGAAGAVFVDGEVSGHLPAPDVEAVDTTAAGDAFCAALTDALLAGKDMEEATAAGVRAGSLTVTRRGAQSSLPYREELV